MDEKLKTENQIALQLVQASLGLISARIMAIGFTISGDRIEISFAVHEGFDEMNDIEEIEFELDVLTDGKYEICHKIGSAGDRLNLSMCNQRLIFKEKP